MLLREVLAATAVTAAGTVLGLSAPTPSAAVAQLAETPRATDLSVPLVAAACLLAWTLLGYLVLVGALTVAIGRSRAGTDTPAAVLRRCAPAGLRRTVAATLGIGLLIGTGTGAASAATPTSFDWPSGAAPTSAAPAAPAPAGAVSGEPDQPPDQPDPPHRVVVAAGDTLWAISAAALPADADNHAIAQAWPSWWSANREVIGDDPNLLFPGQRLRPPH